MKSIFIVYGMILGSLILFLSFCWYVQFDHTQNVTEMAVKRALLSTMADYVERDNFEAQDAFDTFTTYFKELALEDYIYYLTLSGFMKEPLFMRIHCQAINQSRLKGMRIEVDEAMVEELSE